MNLSNYRLRYRRPAIRAGSVRRDFDLDLDAALVEGVLGGLQGGDDPDPVPAVGAGAGPGAAALQEVVQLQGQGLGQVGAGDVQVAPAQAELELAEAAGHRVGPLVVDAQLGLRIEVVEDHHPPRADHGGAAELGGVQPGHVQVGQDPAVVAEGGEDYVLDLGVQVAGAPGRHPARGRADQVVGDRDVVGSDRPQGVDVALDAAQVDPLGVQVPEVAEVAGLHQLPHPGHGRVVLEGVADGQDPAGGLSGLGQGDGLGRGQGQGLLDQHVLAGGQGVGDQRGVGAGGGGDHQGVDLRVGHD